MVRGRLDDRSPGLWERQRVRSVAALAAALNASFYLLVLLVVAGAVGALAAVVFLLGGLGLYLVVFPAGILLAAIRRILRSAVPTHRDDRTTGLSVSREDQPRLWAVVDDVCERVGQRQVDDLRITLAGSAAAAEIRRPHTRWHVRTLSIPLTYLAVLAEGELRGVVAHELYHFAHGDAGFARRLVAVRAALARTLWRLDRIGSVLRYPFRWYARVLSRFLASLWRQQEFGADAFAAMYVGAESVARGLRVTEWVESAFAAFWHGELAPLLGEGLRPPIAAGYALFLSSRNGLGGLAAFKADDLETPVATHPAVVERLAALKVDADGAPETIHPAVSLIDRLDELEAALLRTKQEPEGQQVLRAVGWSEALQTSLPKAWRTAARTWADRVPSMTAAELPRFIDEHLFDDAECSSEEKLHVLSVLGSSFADALVEAGWSLDASPGGPTRLLRENQEVRPFEEVWALGGSVLLRRAWVDRCHDAGIEDLVLTSAATEPSVPAPRSEAQPVTLLLESEEARGPLSRGVTWVCWIAGVLWLAILLVGAIRIPNTSASVFMGGVALLIACGLIWLFVSQRSLRRDPPRIRFDQFGVVLTHPGLLKEALRIPTHAIRAVTLDLRERSASLRFPIFADSAWSDPYAHAAEPRSWFWVEGRPAQPVPYFGLRKHAPNLFVLLDEAVPGPRVRRERLHGPLNGETLSAFMLTVADPPSAENALSNAGIARRLVVSDFRPLNGRASNRPTERSAAA